MERRGFKGANRAKGVQGFIKRPVDVRFWEMVDKRGPEECWPWLGATRRGYGKFTHRDAQRMAHRVAWELANGGIPPKELDVCHRCDNPPCCNPAHLFLGTESDNLRDCVAKGRNVTQRGEEHPAHKLTEDQVRELRRRAANGEPVARLAKGLGIAQATARRIVLRRMWKHVG